MYWQEALESASTSELLAEIMSKLMSIEMGEQQLKVTVF